MLEDKDANSSPSQNNEFDSSCAAYLRRAVKACAAGDEELGLHLYLAAYEKGTRENGGADADAAFALRKAWVLAVKLKERSLAEYIFEKLAPGEHEVSWGHGFGFDVTVYEERSEPPWS